MRKFTKIREATKTIRQIDPHQRTSSANCPYKNCQNERDKKFGKLSSTFGKLGFGKLSFGKMSTTLSEGQKHYLRRKCIFGDLPLESRLLLRLKSTMGLRRYDESSNSTIGIRLYYGSLFHPWSQNGSLAMGTCPERFVHFCRFLHLC